MNVRKAARILVITAHRNAMRYYRRLLEAQGHGVEMFTFPETNQAEIERWHPDLIVFDLLVGAKQEWQAWVLYRLQRLAKGHLDPHSQMAYPLRISPICGANTVRSI